MILPELLQKVSLFSVLHKIDTDLAEQQKQSPCCFCAGRLHSANYERKPRGGPKHIPDEYMIRQSLCCSQCRRRTLPPSCLFMGRRVYWGCVILVVMALRQNRAHAASIGELRRMFGISHKTICRWIVYFRDEFPATAQWQRLRGRVTALIANHELPTALLAYFIDQLNCAQQGLSACLYFLATGLLSV
jgi:hypothetical protein